MPATLTSASSRVRQLRDRGVDRIGAAEIAVDEAGVRRSRFHDVEYVAPGSRPQPAAQRAAAPMPVAPPVNATTLLISDSP